MGTMAPESGSQANEAERLRILQAYQVLDTPPEAALDDLTRLAARLCRVPIATVSLVDDRRQWFKSAVGWPFREISRDVALCDHAIRDTEPLIIPDTLQDERVRENPLVTGEPHLRFYAAVPLISPEQAALGTLSVMDREPRHLTPDQLADLNTLANQVVAQFELRRQRAQLNDLLRQQKIVRCELQRQAEHVAEAQRIAQVGSWEMFLEQDRLEWTAECYRIFGLSPKEFGGNFGAFLERVHPEDRDRLMHTQAKALDSNSLLDVEHRIVRPGGEVRYVRERAQVLGAPGDPERRLSGTVQDITEQKQAEIERQQLLEREHEARTSAERNESLFRAAFDNMLAGFIITSATGDPIAVNARFCEMLGYTETEFRQKSIRELTAPEDWPKSAEMIRKIMDGEIAQFTLDKHYLHKSGRRIPARIFVAALRGTTWEGLGTVGLALDMTQEKQVLEELRRNQWLMRVAGQVAHVGGWAIDATTRELLWSDEVRAIHEAPPDYVPSLSDGIHMFTPEWRPVIRQAVENCLRHGVPYDLEIEKFTMKGRRIWVRTIGQAERNEAGEIIRIQGAFQDITEVKSAQIEVARAAEQLRTTLESISDAFVTIDRDWRYTYVNGEAEWLLERSADELLGKRIWDEFPESVGSPIETAFTRAMRDHVSVSFEQHYPPLKRWFQINVYPSTEGIAVYFQNITEKRETQQQIENAWARTRRILDTSVDVIAMTDSEGRFVEVNSRCQAVWGYTPAELIGRVAIELAHPEDREATIAAGYESVNSGSPASYQNRCIHKDGHIVYVQWTAVWSDPDQLCFIVARDVTDQVAAEERARQSQRMEAIGQLTGGVAHDFNNLLTVVLGSSELLVEELSSQTRLRPLAELIRTAALRGAELTRGLLAFARRQALEPRTVTVPQLIERMHNLVLHSLGENIEIELTFSSDVWPVIADPAQLESALLNLCLNARDAMPQGGHLLIEADNVVLDEQYAKQNNDVTPGAYVAISVSDTGTGMAPEVAARAFDPFFTTKARDKGTGLGLSMVYGFARQTGGHVKIYTEPGHGTTVKLYVPRSSEAPPAEEPAEVDHLLRGTEHILVVEDDDLVREFAADMLTSLGYRVTLAANAAEAIEIVRQGVEFDLLFTDVVMPGMNGPQMAQEILRLRPDLPVLYTSGYTENAIVHQGRVDPGVNLLHKPYRRQTLAEKIRQLLATRPPEETE